MSLVTAGMGSGGPIVTAGLGLTEPDPDELRAALHGVATLTATLTATSTTPPDLDGWYVRRPGTRRPRRRVLTCAGAALCGRSTMHANLTGPRQAPGADMTATLTGTSTLSAEGVGDVEAYNRDALDLLLLYLARTPADDYADAGRG